MKRNLKICSFGLLLLVSASCSKRVIVRDANPALDPFPAELAAVNKAADPLVANQKNMVQIKMDAVWAAANAVGSRRVTVAILGSGVDYNHEDLMGNIGVNRKEWRALTPGKMSPGDLVDDDANGYVDDFIGYDFVDSDGLPYDRNGSGTAMAGIVGAMASNGVGIRGMAGEVTIVPVRFIDNQGTFFLPGLVKALKYAHATKVDIILLHLPNYSFGSRALPFQSKEEITKVEKASTNEVLTAIEKAGTPMVISAGNSGLLLGKENDLLNEFKKRNNVLVVTGVDDQDKRVRIANFSRAHVDTTAPGFEIMTTLPGNNYGLASGTSVAAAHVAGALALAVSRHYSRASTETLVKGFIRPEASDAIEGLQFETIGGNRLNVQKYLSYLENP